MVVLKNFEWLAEKRNKRRLCFLKAYSKQSSHKRIELFKAPRDYQLILARVVIKYFTESFSKKANAAESPIIKKVCDSGAAGKLGIPTETMIVPTTRLSAMAYKSVLLGIELQK